DTNKNALYDNQEKGLNGVLVYLLDKNGNRLKDTNNNDIYTITGNDNNGNPGYYTFVNIEKGEYRIEFSGLAGYGYINSSDLGNPLNTLASDYDIKDKKTSSFLLSSDVVGLDGGFTLFNIGDNVFNDTNYNGLFDEGEQGLGGLKLTLSKNNVVVATTISDSKGYYFFNDLLPGDYIIEIDKTTNLLDSNNPNQYLFYAYTTAHAGDNKLDSDFEVVASTLHLATTKVTLALEDDMALDNNNLDAGLYLGNSLISGKVFEDLKKDNIYGLKPVGSDKEDFISNVEVRLYNSRGFLLLTSLSDVNGAYSFNNLPPDDYIVEIVEPNLYSLVLPKVGNDTSIDSDFNQTSKKTSALKLGFEESIINIDAGLKQAGNAVVSGFAFVDDNYDCTYIAGNDEDVYGGLKVTLLLDGIEIATQLTKPDGSYQFTNLEPGNYQINFFEKEDLITIGNTGNTIAGVESNLSLNISLPTNNTILNNPPVGGVCLQYEKAGIGDYVWLDLNRNGLQDSDEVGLKDIELILYMNNNEHARTKTNGDGHYFFSDLQANNEYYVEVVLPDNNEYRLTSQIQGNNVKNSYFTPTGNVLIGTSVPIILGPDQSSTIYDAGLVYTPSSIGNRIWFDENQDSIQ
ncbi:MAG: SdrD B-like domain-containing protein, partial [Bacilli bacterium]